MLWDKELNNILDAQDYIPNSLESAAEFLNLLNHQTWAKLMSDDLTW